MQPAEASWLGQTETATDVAAPGPLARLAALLDHAAPPWPEGALPPLAHWLYFLPHARQSQLGEDGHPARADLIAGTPLPRRMWAGSRLEFRQPIRIGAEITKRSTNFSFAPKTGKSGTMLFITIRHEIFAGAALCVVEEQDIVYRGAPGAGSPAAPPAGETRPDAPAARLIHAGPVLLFRFSALTYNSHRIHYDRDYARNAEGYEGLVVHGPLIATLLMDHLLRQRPGQPPARFCFRAQRPLFDTAPFSLNAAFNAQGAELWAAAPGAPAAMSARAEWA